MRPMDTEIRILINSEWFRERFTLIIENYEENPTFRKIPPEQVKHMVDELISCLEESNDI